MIIIIIITSVQDIFKSTDLISKTTFWISLHNPPPYGRTDGRTDRPTAAEMRPVTFYALIVTVPLRGRTVRWKKKKKNQFISPLRSTNHAAVHMPAIPRQASVLIIISSLNAIHHKEREGFCRSEEVTARISAASSLELSRWANILCAAVIRLVMSKLGLYKVIFLGKAKRQEWCPWRNPCSPCQSRRCRWKPLC